MTYDELQAHPARPFGYLIASDVPDKTTENIFMVGTLIGYSPRMLANTKFPCRVCDHNGVCHDHMLGLELVTHLQEEHEVSLLQYVGRYEGFPEVRQLPERREP